MAKISVSISDELKARLDKRAEEDGMAVSHVVSMALKQYLDGPAVTPEESQPIGASSEEWDELRDYLWVLSSSYEQTRNACQNVWQWGCSCGAMLGYPPGPPIPRPPWPRRKSLEPEVS